MTVLSHAALRVVALAVVGALMILVLFAYLMGVSKMDVSVKHDMNRHVVAEPFEAGDVVALSPDGQRLGGFLCDIQPSAEAVNNLSIQARYYNIVDASQDQFFRFVDKTRSALGLSVPGAAVASTIAERGMPFVGHVSRVVTEFEAMMPRGCLCAVAKAVVERRQSACVVEKALVESQMSMTDDGPVIRKTVGVSFREEPIKIADLDALAAHCPGLNTGAIIPTNQSCRGNSGFTFDSVVRVRAGLIREEPLSR